MSIYIAGASAALTHAGRYLQKAGMLISPSASWDVRHLLLDVPSFRPGSDFNIDTVLSSLPKNITVWGGNLNHSSLEGYRCVDLLKDEQYLLKNAYITAECTFELIRPMLSKPWPDNNVMIIGYGRIGKYLIQILGQTGCRITVVSRDLSPVHRAVKVSLEEALDRLSDFDIIINTAPAAILGSDDLSNCGYCLKIDLASVKGIAGDDVIWARGLPGRCAPEQSGMLIAQTILRIMKEETQ